MSGTRAARLPRWLRRISPLRVAILVVLISAALLAMWWLAQGANTLLQPLTRQALGKQLLAQGRPYEATQVFEDPFWQGIAHFRSGRYQRAAKVFHSLEGTAALYNLASAYAHLRRYDDAIDSLRAVLDAEPTHADAQHNLELLRAAKRGRQDDQRSNAGPDQGGAQRKQADSKADAAPVADRPPTTLKLKTSDEPPPDNGGKKSGQNADAANARFGGRSGSGKKAETKPESDPSQAAAARVSRPVEVEPEERREAPDGIGSLSPEPADKTEEDALAEQIEMRRLHDDPARVLRARLRAAAEQRVSRR